MVTSYSEVLSAVPTLVTALPALIREDSDAYRYMYKANVWVQRL